MPTGFREVLLLKGVSKTVGGEVVLEKIFLAVNPGESVLIKGRSGVGKTTLAKIAALIVEPDSGEVFFNGISISKLTSRDRAQLRLRKIGYIDQYYTLIPELTVIENVELPLALQGIPRAIRRKRALEIIAEMGLKGKENMLPEKLSGGEKQRVAIARALAKKPALFVGDEPFSNLDDETIDSVYETIVREIRERKMSAIITTTNFELKIKTNKQYILKRKKLLEK